MYNLTALETVDPRYRSYIRILMMLKALDVVDIDQNIYRISVLAGALGGHNPKPHWVKMAITSLSLDYIEIFAKGRR